VAGGEYSDVLEQDVLVVVKPVLHHCQLARLCKQNAAGVFNPDLNGLPGLSNADQITLTANAMANNFDVVPGKDPANAAECCPGIWSIKSIENNMSAYVYHFSAHKINFVKMCDLNNLNSSIKSIKIKPCNSLWCFTGPRGQKARHSNSSNCF